MGSPETGVAGGLESGVIGVVERGIKYLFVEPHLIAQGRPKCYLSCKGRNSISPLGPNLEALSLMMCLDHVTDD